jgi:hypothetical protein
MRQDETPLASHRHMHRHICIIYTSVVRNSYFAIIYPTATERDGDYSVR